MSTVSLPVEFSTKRRETPPFKIDDAPFILKGCTAAGAKQYRAASLIGAEMQVGSDDSRTIRRMQGLVEAEPLLVSLCLFKIDGDKHVAVTQKTVESWPSSVVKQLYETAKDISDLGEEEDLAKLTKERDKLNTRIAKLNGSPSQEEQEKNLSPDSTGGSA
jgi:hypothetical protein